VKRRRATPAQRLRPFWFLIGLVAVLCLVGGYLLAMWPALRPHRVEVSGNRVVSVTAILASAQIDYGANIWLQNTHAMATRIEAIPYIRTASVHRRLPGTINITVTERVPYAVLEKNGARNLVDETLRVLGPADARDAALPVLAVSSNQRVDQLAIVVDQAEKAQLEPARVSFDEYGDVTMKLRGGIDVLLGDPSTTADKMPLVKPILEKVDRGPRKVAAIDLRALTTPVVVYAR